jgi:RNA polymerase sigma-70 factor (ECF subfamily)
VDPALNDWFVREVLPHERILTRFLCRAWRNRAEVDDLLQEIYVRVYESAARARPQAVKAFLFSTARNLMVDRIRRERVVSIESGGDSDFSNVYRDEITPERRLSAHQELMLLMRVFTRMSPRCREVMWLRRVDDLSQKEVARQLGISEKTVESYLARACEFMADGLFRRKPIRAPWRASDDESESTHGKQ